MAAGAVAELRAPRSSPSARSFVYTVTSSATRNMAVRPSEKSMEKNCLPYFLKTECFSSPPTMNPIRASAREVSGVRWSRRSLPRMPLKESPIRIPNTI